MTVQELLAYLPEQDIAQLALSDPDCEVLNIAFLTSETLTSLRGDIIYFSDSETMPQAVPDCTHFNYVQVDGGPLPEALASQHNVNLISLAQGVNLFTCYNTLQAAFTDSQDVVNIIRRLLNAHFSNQGLQYLIEEAASALHNPIVVVDPTYRYIAHHLGDLMGGDTRLARVMTQEIANETLLEDAVAYIRDSKIDSELARSKGPYEHFNTILECNTMIMAVMVRGVCVAHVMMMEHVHPFTDLDRKVFVRLTSFVAQEMQKSEIWGPTSGELGSYFLENLLNDPSPSDAVTRRRMKALNFHPKELLFVICLHASGEGLSQIQAENVAAQLRPLLHHALYTRHHQQLVCLLSRDPDVGFSDRAARKLREVAALNNLTVGVSNQFTSIIDTRRGYDQARSAIRCGEQLSPYMDDQRLYRYGDVSYVQMLNAMGRRTNLLSYCHPALLALMEYDNNHSGELMETLFCYLQLAGSTTRAAKALSLHKNTMLYRIGRIREILGMDLASGEDLFLLQMGFRVLLNLGLFAPRLRFAREELRLG